MQLIRHARLNVAALFLMGLSSACLAQEQPLELELPESSSATLFGYGSGFEPQDFPRGTSFESKGFDGGYRNEGLQPGNDSYFGSARVSGEKGRGTIFEQGKFTVGFDQRGLAFERHF
jgi:hypothetical protein